MIHVRSFTFNVFDEKTYVIWDDELKEAAIVDAGNSDAGEDKILFDFIDENSLKVKYLINTHCHIDHILGCDSVKKKFNPDFLIPEKESILLEHAGEQAVMFGLEFHKPPKPDLFINENTKLSIGNFQLKFLYTPGHTPGELCIYFEKENICLTGDVLFKEGIGRTDLLGGDYNTIISSIELKLFTLPDDVVIYPGHGDSSTIGHEKKYNPFFN